MPSAFESIKATFSHVAYPPGNRASYRTSHTRSFPLLRKRLLRTTREKQFGEWIRLTLRAPDVTWPYSLPIQDKRATKTNDHDPSKGGSYLCITALNGQGNLASNGPLAAELIRMKGR